MQNTVDTLSPTDRMKIVEFLKANPVAVIATVDQSGGPQASTIYINVDDNLNVSFTTKRDTRKYENIISNNKVMLVVYDATSQSVVQISGRANEVTDPEHQSQIYHGTLNAAKQTGEDVVPPVAKIAAGPYVGFSIQIDNIWLTEYGWGNNFANAMKHAKDQESSGDPN